MPEPLRPLHIRDLVKSVALSAPGLRHLLASSTERSPFTAQLYACTIANPSATFQKHRPIYTRVT